MAASNISSLGSIGVVVLGSNVPPGQLWLVGVHDLSEVDELASWHSNA